MDKLETLEAHYRQNRDKLAKYAAYRLGNNTAMGEDAVQEAYLKALKFLERYDHTRNFPAWFGTILNNAITDIQRLERDKGVVRDDLAVDHVGDEYIAKKEIMELIQQEKKANRNLLHMFFFEGFNARQIADFLEISHASVRQIITRFRDKVAVPLRVD